MEPVPIAPVQWSHGDGKLGTGAWGVCCLTKLVVELKDLHMAANRPANWKVYQTARSDLSTGPLLWSTFSTQKEMLRGLSLSFYSCSPMRRKSKVDFLTYSNSIIFGLSKNPVLELNFTLKCLLFLYVVICYHN